MSWTTFLAAGWKLMVPDRQGYSNVLFTQEKILSTTQPHGNFQMCLCVVLSVRLSKGKTQTLACDEPGNAVFINIHAIYGYGIKPYRTYWQSRLV